MKERKKKERKKERKRKNFKCNREEMSREKETVGVKKGKRMRENKNDIGISHSWPASWSMLSFLSFLAYQPSYVI